MTEDTPYIQGWKARINCQPRSSNPYPIPSDAADSWLRGWENAHIRDMHS